MCQSAVPRWSMILIPLQLNPNYDSNTNAFNVSVNADGRFYVPAGAWVQAQFPTPPTAFPCYT